MKSMLLFFDGIALALPENLAAETIDRDPLLAIPLAERGLLVNFDPANIIDTRTANALASALTKIVLRQKIAQLATSGLTPLHYGAPAAPEAVHRFEAVLFKRGLLKRTRDPLVVELNSDVRLLVLTLFAQALRARLIEHDVVIHPITDSISLAIGLEQQILRSSRSDAESVSMDDLYPSKRWLYGLSSWHSDPMDPRQLEADLFDVGTDLSSVPLDEVLDFRQQNGEHYRAYAAGLRQFLISQAQVSKAERDHARNDRRLEILDQAVKLRRLSRAAFGIRSSVLLLSLIGASWTAKHGDPVGALLAALTAATQAIPTPERTVTAYSYLLKTVNLQRR
jgi:hypothetical protein